MIIAKYISTNTLNNKRTITVNMRGKYDPRTANECVPFGIDSSPVAGMEAIYAFTENSERSVIVGYVNTKALAAEGEIRLYANSGRYIWLKNDGTIEIGGNTKHMVRFEELETAFNELKGDFNALVSYYNSHQHAAPPGGGPTTGNTNPGSTSSADISPAKIDEIKTL